MTTEKTLYREQVIEEFDKIPPECLPALLKLMRAFREGVTLPTAEETFRQGWQEALAEEALPVAELWEDSHEPR